jgi:hypothetical protein
MLRMMRAGFAALLAATCSFSLNVDAADPTRAVGSAVEQDIVSLGPGLAAQALSAERGRYLLVFCWRAQDAETKAAKATFDAVAAKVHAKADAASVQLSAKSEADFVKQFELSRTPVPLVLVIAPNGVVTFGKIGKVTEPEIREAFLTPAACESLAAFQKGQLVLVCFRREGAIVNAAADAGVTAFKADPNYGNATRVITVNTDDPAEAEFLAELEVSPQSTTPVTVLLAPPGGLVTKIAGPVSKAMLVSALQAAGTCGPNGCGPNGCCPGGVCKPGQVSPAAGQK